MSIQFKAVVRTRSTTASFPAKLSRSEPPKVPPWKFWNEPGGAWLFASNLAIFLVLLCAIPLWMFGAGREVALIAASGAVGWWLIETCLHWFLD